MKLAILTCFIGLCIGCTLQSQKREMGKFTANERHYCDSLDIDTSLIIELKKISNSPIEPFHYSLARQYQNGTETEIDPILLQGLIFKETTRNTEFILAKLYDTFNKKGYTLFVVDKNFGIENKPDVMGILKTADKYEVLAQIQTDGINYDIDTDSLIKIIKSFDAKYSLSLVGAGGDWCEFTINKAPADWMAFAEEAYKVCPDIVDQGTETVKALATEMKRTNRLYFWWD
jgi:hypothetical protein